jgi:hypothetical protein
MDTRSSAKTTGTNFHSGRTIPSLRWRIGALLFASTVINYIDRQTLSLLAPYLKQDYHWTNTDYGNLVIGFGLALLIPTILTVNLYVLTLLFALATFSYASFTTIANVLPSDLYKNESVATVSGAGAALGTIIVFELAGHLSHARIARGTHLFDPLMVIAGLIPFVGMILALMLVRNTKTTDQGLVCRI